MLWKLSFAITLLFWPISLFLTNTFQDLIVYAIPALLILLSVILYMHKKIWYIFPLTLIPLIEPKLTLFPTLFLLTELLFSQKGRVINTVFLSLAVVLLIVKFNGFYGQTIFVPDYEAGQEVIRNTHLYPNVIMARTFQNKVIVIVNKFYDNFFSLTDLNNYFFGFAPRQIVGNQNLIKFPFLAIFVVLFFIINLKNIKPKGFIFRLLLSSILSLSVLTNFDRNDFILLLPLCIVLFYGFKLASRQKSWIWFVPIYITFTILELIRIFVIANT